MPLTFVNYRGERVSTAAVHQPVCPKVGTEVVEIHKGFQAEGFTPAMIEAARAEREEVNVLRRETGREPLPPFDDEAWMRQSKPKKLKVYAIESAARECCRLAEHAGWRNCRVTELRKKVFK